MMRKNSLVFSYGIFLTLLGFSSATNVIDCLTCWDILCGDSSLGPNDCHCQCVNYNSSDSACNLGQIAGENNNICCPKAEGYISTIVTPSIELVEFNNPTQCLNVYNDIPDDFDISNYENNFELDHQYIYQDIQFSCSGCIRNVTISSLLGVQDTLTFTVQLWSKYHNNSDNATIFVMTNNTSVTVDSSDSSDSVDNTHLTVGSIDDQDFCFNQGDIFGLTLPASDPDPQVLTIKDDPSSNVYARQRPNCESLREVYYVQNEDLSDRPLIAIGIEEIMQVQSSSSKPQSPSPSNSLSSTVSFVEVTTTNTSTTTTIIRTSATTTTTSTTTTAITTTTLVATSTRVQHSTFSSTSVTQSNTNPPASSDPIIFIGAGAGVGFVVVLLCIVVIAIVLACILVTLKKKSKTDVEGTVMSSRDALDFQTENRSVHQYIQSPGSRDNLNQSSFFLDEPDNPLVNHNQRNEFNQSLTINDYDDPIELNLAGFKRSQGGLSTVREGGGQEDRHYMTMYNGIATETPSVGTSRSNLSDNSYKVPRQINRYQAPICPPMHYDSPRSPATSSLSEYDDPIILEKQPQKVGYMYSQENLGHNYHVLEDPNKQGERMYFILEQHTNQPPTKHIYHELEPGYHVPSTRERFSLYGGSGDSAVLTPTDVTQHFFEEQPQYWEPAENTENIYDQLNQKKCRELPPDDIIFSNEVGHGQFGTVWSGKWKLHGGGMKEVAIKVLKSSAQEIERARFLREGARMMQFFHSNVVQLYGVVTVGEPILLVLELMKEGDLRAYLKNCRPDTGIKPLPPLKYLLKFCRDIASGMRHLAKKKFVHRDLAARNVLLNDQLICKIGDFGMTRATGHTYDLSKAEQVPLRWTAPEALNGRIYSEHSDIYSYGMVLFEIWSLGRKPFPNLDQNQDIIDFISQGRVMSPPPGCPRSIYRLMVQCWHPNPKDRPVFADICEDYLYTDDETLLSWNTEDRRASQKASEIGAQLSEGFYLYNDLQRIYRTDDD